MLHPNEPGLTWDPDANGKAKKEGLYVLPGFRLNRILIKSDAVKLDQASQVSLNDN